MADLKWGPHAKYSIGSWLRYRCRSSWPGTIGRYRVYSRYSVFEFSGKIRLYYLPQEDAFCCPEGAKLVYQRLNCSQTTGKYLRCYQVEGDTCRYCKQNPTCFKQTGIRRRILGSSCYPAFYRGHERIGSDTYWHMMRLRKIWAEGSFSVLKREHCLSKVRKRGIPAVTEECLLSAMALNLKRMVKAILLTSRKLKIWTENIRFQSRFLLYALVK